MESDQPHDTYRIQEFSQWFTQCQTHDELDAAARCAKQSYEGGTLTKSEYQRVCVLGGKRRMELSQ
jgi:hypothetical protein